MGNDLKVFPSKAYMLGKDFFEIGNIMYNKSIKRKKEKKREEWLRRFKLLLEAPLKPPAIQVRCLLKIFWFLFSFCNFYHFRLNFRMLYKHSLDNFKKGE